MNMDSGSKWLFILIRYRDLRSNLGILHVRCTPCAVPIYYTRAVSLGAYKRQFHVLDIWKRFLFHCNFLLCYQHRNMDSLTACNFILIKYRDWRSNLNHGPFSTLMYCTVTLYKHIYWALGWSIKTIFLETSITFYLKRRPAPHSGAGRRNVFLYDKKNFGFFSKILLLETRFFQIYT